MELYGLVSFIDPHIFGDEPSYREQFVRVHDEDVRNQELRRRLAPVCQRTLRRQVLEYIKFTQRIPLTWEFRAKRDEFPNLTVKKIPQAVLDRCEWGRHDYSLNVDSLPPIEAARGQSSVREDTEVTTTDGRPAKGRGKKRTSPQSMQQIPLFDQHPNASESE